MTAPAVPPDAPRIAAHKAARASAKAGGLDLDIVDAAVSAYHAALDEAGLLARSEGEAVEALRRQCADDVGQVLTRAGIAEDQRDRLRGELKEAVRLLRRLVAAAGIMDSAESRLEAMVTVAWDARAFLSRSGSRPGPDAPSYGETT